MSKQQEASKEATASYLVNTFCTQDGASTLLSLMSATGYGKTTLIQCQDNSVDPIGSAYNQGRKSVVEGIVAELCAGGRSDVVEIAMKRIFHIEAPTKEGAK